MRCGIVIQARMGSTRLPGKVLRRVGGRTLLDLCAARCGRARHAGEVIVATTDGAADGPVVAEAERLGLACVRGSEEDVLSRFRLAAERHALDVVCRVTSDCPLIDPGIIDAVFGLFFAEGHDYASNTLRRLFPRGLDVEVFGRAALERAHAEAKLPAEREHVTPYFYLHPELFSLGSLDACEDLSAHRWTVDEPDDLRFVGEVVARLGSRASEAGYREVLALLAAEPELARINAHVGQKDL